MHYTREQIDAIKEQTDLVALAQYVGYTPRRIGRYYTLQDHDSVRIYDHKKIKHCG